MSRRGTAELFLREEDPGLGRFAAVECLELVFVSHVPVSSLPFLRRLCLHDFAGDLDQLLTDLLASEQRAANLAAFSTRLAFTAKPSGRWWASLAGFTGLREFGFGTSSSVDVADEFAALLASLGSLAVLKLTIPAAATLRVLRHGLPPNVRTLCLWVVEQRESSVAFLDLLPSLPQSLVALHYVDYTRRTDADTRALLSHCRQLRCMALRCTEDAAQYLASGEVKQTLLLNSFHTPERLQGALVAAGHKIGTVRIGVDWRVAGGVLFNGQSAGI